MCRSDIYFCRHFDCCCSLTNCERMLIDRNTTDSGSHFCCSMFFVVLFLLSIENYSPFFVCCCDFFFSPASIKCSKEWNCVNALQITISVHRTRNFLLHQILDLYCLHLLFCWFLLLLLFSHLHTGDVYAVKDPRYTLAIQRIKLNIGDGTEVSKNSIFNSNEYLYKQYIPSLCWSLKC